MMNILKKGVLIVVVVFMVVLSGCSNGEKARQALESAGYTSIKTDGYAWFSCSDDDFYQTKFTAVNPQGKRVNGVVCSGMFFKKSTIRL
jgi:uncharacterized membrane protein